LSEARAAFGEGEEERRANTFLLCMQSSHAILNSLGLPVGVHPVTRNACMHGIRLFLYFDHFSLVYIRFIIVVIDAYFGGADQEERHRIVDVGF